MEFTSDEILETIGMIAEDKLDIRTVTLGISLLDCSDPDPAVCARKVREKILEKGSGLSREADFVANEYGLPIVNKRVSITPISLVVPSDSTSAFVEVAHAVGEDEAVRVPAGCAIRRHIRKRGH